MNDFISIIRTDRYREIEKYKNIGYSFNNEKQYRLIDVIQVSHKGFLQKFGVQVTERDIYFYLVDDKANAYYSIQEIYELLIDISYREGIDFVVDILKNQMNIKIQKIQDPSNLNKEITINQEEFIYRGISYYIKRTAIPPRNGTILPIDSSEKISYLQLFMLINLIQEKSNALFLRGIGNEPYIDGLIRFLIVLVFLDHDVDILNIKGWYFDAGSEKFKYLGADKGTKKYYLTKKEYLDIMPKES